MTTPTREQVIEQAIQGHAGTRMAMQWLFDQAHTAGRDQGLREAKEVCEAMHDEYRPGDYVAAIEQLEVK